jgi:hypothetical protein
LNYWQLWKNELVVKDDNENNSVDNGPRTPRSKNSVDKKHTLSSFKIEQLHEISTAKKMVGKDKPF